MTDARQLLRILVVDDSPVYRKLVEHALSRQDYAILYAKSGGEALELFAQHQPPIVVTDWMMPDISGLELCRRIHTELQKSYTYVILLTGNTEKDRIVEGLAAGADDYLTKPFHPDELRARVGVGCRAIDLHRELEAKTRRLEELAQTDPLTGLPNRRAIEEWAERQLRGAARHGFPVWVVLADLDCFKNINDLHGHQAGDEVLKGFASLLRSNTRACDICARIGGEEFVLLVTHVKQENVLLIVERLRQQFASQTFAFGGKTVRLTASFGVAGFEEKQDAGFDRLLREADKALYDAKREGRNRAKLEVLPAQ